MSRSTGSSEVSEVVVALPAYNEDRYIGSIVDKITGYADIVIVLDDGSTDGTAWASVNAGAKLLQHKVNRGYGAAIQSILSAVRGSDFSSPDVLVILDSDNQHDPADIPQMVDAAKNGYDLVIGCRAGKDVPFYRRIGGTILSVATWILSGVWVRDSQCGFRAYSPKAVDVIHPKETGMAVSSEIVALAAWAGLKIKEVPIEIRYLDTDEFTHNPWKQGFYTLWRILVMMMRRRLGK